jgi:hypothetical protein
MAKQAVIALTHTIDTVVIFHFTGKAQRAGFDERNTKNLVDGIVMRDEVRQGVAVSAAQVAEKYGVIGVMPEITLVGYLGAYFGSIVRLNLQMEKLIKRNEAAHNTQVLPNAGDGANGKR